MSRLKALLYLEFRQYINSIKNTARSPKRLIPALLIGAWILSSIIQSLVLFSGGARHRTPQIDLLARVPVDIIETGIFLLLSIGSVMVLYGAFSSGLLVFSVAHIDFLFPTPISRRKVLLVKLLQDYVKYGFWVALFFMFFGSVIFGALSVRFLPWGLVSMLALVALLILVVNLAHTINVVSTFGYERMKQFGLLVKGIMILAPVTAIAYGVSQYVTTGSTYASVLLAASSPVVRTIFAPARWCAKLFLAPMTGITNDEFALFGILWLMAAGSLLLLLSRRENVYEPSLGVSVKHAKRRLAARTGDYSGVRLDTMREKGTKRVNGPTIPPFGLGGTALLWKNLLLRYRVSRGQVVAMLIMPLIIVWLVRTFIPDPDVRRFLPMVLVYMVWILSIMAQVETRAELKHANIVKSMPIAAWKVTLAQTMGAVAYLSAGALVFSAYLWALVPESRGPVLLACAAGAPFLGFANIPAAMIPAILYPDTRDMAQNYISGMVGFVLTGIAVLPTVVLGSVLIFALQAPIYLTLLVLCLANLVVGAAGIALAGLAFRKFDPTSD